MVHVLCYELRLITPRRFLHVDVARRGEKGSYAYTFNIEYEQKENNELNL